jgi:hypothetical protein
VFDADLGGHLVADFITAGHMSANRIQAGVLESVDTITIAGVTVPVTSLNLNDGSFKTYSGSIENTEIISSIGTKRIQIEGATLRSQALVNGAVSTETVIDNGGISTGKLIADRADIKSGLGSLKVGLVDGKLSFFYDNNAITTVTNTTSRILCDLKSASLDIGSSVPSSGWINIGEEVSEGSGGYIRNMNIAVPMTCYGRALMGSGSSSYSVTLDGKTLTFINGLLISVT